MNDEKTAWKYTFDIDTIRKNCLEMDHSNIEYDILHEHTSIEDILYIKESIIEIEIRTKYELELKLTTVIKRCLNLSSNQLGKMLESGVITILPSVAIKKCKVRNGIKIFIYKDNLRSYLA